MSYGDEWRNYVPPAGRGDGESALPTGVGRRRDRDDAAAATGAAQANGRQSGRGARIAAKPCYVDIGGSTFVRGDDARAAGINRRKGDWLRFHSEREGKRWIELKAQERAGEIRDLRRQVPFPLMVKRVTDGVYVMIATWTCDFEYQKFDGDTPLRGWQRVVEDCKGHRTEIYLRSKKHFEAQYGIAITET